MEKTFLWHDYSVRVIYKKIKNTYLRVNKGEVVVTTAFRTKEKDIKDFIVKNKNKIDKMLTHEVASDKIYYQGKSYEKIKMASQKNIEFYDNKVFFANEKQLDNWYRKMAHYYFEQLLIDEQAKMKEKIKTPMIKIRKMKTRWGVCHRKKQTIVLNIDLMRFEEAVIRYVIVHELMHFVYPYHNQAFWNRVASYCPQYQKMRKKLRN